MLAVVRARNAEFRTDSAECVAHAASVRAGWRARRTKETELDFEEAHGASFPTSGAACELQLD